MATNNAIANNELAIALFVATVERFMNTTAQHEDKKSSLRLLDCESF